MAVFEFGPFLLDPSTRSLLRDGATQTLAPKTFDVLQLLIEQRARVVSKDELLQTVWPGTFVEEGNLSQQIFLLRKILGGDDQPEYISTVPRRGYRFVADVRERSEELGALPPGPQPSHALPRRLWGPLIFSLLIAGVASWAYMRWGGSSAETSDPRIVSVTSLPGLESSPSISPDGNFVVFSWTGPNPEGIPDLWVSAVDRDSRQRLTDANRGRDLTLLVAERPGCRIHPGRRGCVHRAGTGRARTESGGLRFDGCVDAGRPVAACQGWGT